MTTTRLVDTRVLFLSAALLGAGGLLFVACSGGQAPTRPTSVGLASSAPAAAAAGAASTSGAATIVSSQTSRDPLPGANTCQPPNTELCHVYNRTGLLDLCVDSAGLAQHQGHPNDYPVTTEVCDNADNDCDGQVDEGGVCSCPCELLYDKGIVLYTLKGGQGVPVLQTGTVGGESTATCVRSDPPLDLTLSSKTSGAAGTGCSVIVREGGVPVEDFDLLVPAFKAQREACVAVVQSRCQP